MRNRDLVNFISSLLGNYSGRYPEHNFKCVKCDHRKFKLAVNFDKKLFHCWVCDYKGNLEYLVKRVDRSRVAEYRRLIGKPVSFTQGKEEQKTVTLPDGFITFDEETISPDLVNAYSYLIKRGFDMNDIKRHNIGYVHKGPYVGRIVFPSFDFNGKLNYFISRTFYEGDKRFKYKNDRIPKYTIVFNEHLVDWEEPVILTEGIFDSVIAGVNAIPILGSSLSKKSKLYDRLLVHQPDVYMALDPDAFDKSIKISKDLVKNGLNVYIVDVRPYNDVNECGKEIFKEKLKSAQKVTMLDLIKLELNTI